MKKINFAEAMSYLIEGEIVTDGKLYYRMSCSRLVSCDKTGEIKSGSVVFKDMDLYDWYVHHKSYTFEQAMKNMLHGHVMWFEGEAYKIWDGGAICYYNTGKPSSITYGMASRDWHDVNTKE